MQTLQGYYEQYQKANSIVTFFHWLEGYVQSISECAKELGYSSIDELRIACRKMGK